MQGAPSGCRLVDWMFRVWHNKGTVHWTRVFWHSLLAYLGASFGLTDAAPLRLVGVCWGFLGSRASDMHCALGRDLCAEVRRFLPLPLRLEEWLVVLLWGQGVDGGRFSAQGTGWRAVKCFDPAQDHQERKHWAGLDLPIKSECAVIEEDQIPL